jgi:hypothetical protein
MSDHNCPFSFEIALTETENFSAIRTFVALATIDVNRPWKVTDLFLARDTNRYNGIDARQNRIRLRPRN